MIIKKISRLQFFFQRFTVKSKFRRPPATNRCKLTNVAHWFSVDFTVSIDALRAFPLTFYSLAFLSILARRKQQKVFPSFDGRFRFSLFLCTRKLEVYWLVATSGNGKLFLPNASFSDPHFPRRKTRKAFLGPSPTIIWHKSVRLVLFTKCNWAE